ncbi:hypothetical protein EUU23_09200 [Sphingorhabdus sp. IMCC26285]|uniref:Lipoprotein n=1 Tax=Sphingorhabdus profundilacus TaxID=2509718 RepID=A0A6I4M0W3_9SPHN|nr:hypothetical protein [Sphingorhabdus profundilacus]MVZ97884.1 hypothetical protein [Sphingorhabdus profundilacus]
MMYHRKVAEQQLSYLIVGLLALYGCADKVTPPTPPLLQNVSAAGGWWNAGCPPRDATEAEFFEPSQEALSPELMERLSREFPVGSDASRLERNLKEQGFSFSLPCDGLSAIHLGEFSQNGGGFNGPYPIFAQIVWEQDDAGKILWTKATVSFTGP